MANNFNFQASLKLNSGGFKKGVNQVKSSLARLKSSFLSVAGALGAGLGFTQLIANIKDTATQLSVAMNTLKNVSYVTKTFKDGVEDVNIEVTNFQENLSFVKRLANDYAQDLVAVTDNYAKFTAACKKTDLALEDQRFVFESLTKAAAYYHLSADRTSDMMNAVTQMMSKGKVAAEELRRQLGNTLPGAFNMMAAAMGVSNAELDKLMRDGKVITSDVLPQFAAMLNTVTKTAEFDSLQSSMNQLKNTWYELIENSGAENMFKGIIDGSTKALSWTSKNVSNIKSVFAGLIAFLLSQNIWKSFISNGEAWVAAQQRQLAEVQRNMARHFSIVKELQKESKININSATGAVSAKEGVALQPSEAAMLVNYNNTLLETIKLKNKLGEVSNARFAAMKRSIDRANASLTGLNNNLRNTAAKGLQAPAKLTNAFKGLGATLKNIGKSALNFLKGNWVTILIGVVVAIWNKSKQIREEIERINNIAKEYANESYKAKKTIESEASILRNNLKIVKDTKQSEASRMYALSEINKIMGLIGEKQLKLSDLDSISDKYDKITEAVEKWIEATKKQALVQHYANQIAEITAKRADAERRKEEAWAKWSEAEGGGDVSVGEIYKAKTAYANASKEIAQYDKALNVAEADMQAAGVAMTDFFSKFDDGSTNGDGGKIETLAELLEKYNKDKAKLENQLKEHAITQEEFNESFDKLVQDYWKNAASLGELSIDDIIKKMDKGSTLTAMEKWYYTLSKDAADAVQRALINGISEEIIKGIDQEIKEAAEAIDEAINKELEKEEKQLNLDIRIATGEFDVKKPDARNPLMDYSKSASDVLGEHFSLSDDWLQDIEDNLDKLIKENKQFSESTEVALKKLDKLGAYYRYAAREAETLETAMNYAKIQEDIKALQKEIGNLVYGGVKDFATTLDRVVSAADTLKKTMEDNDASGWEKFMAVFNLITQIIDGVISMYQTINTVQELSVKLNAAKIAEQTALNKLLKEELALRMAARGATNEEIAARFQSLSTLLAEKGILSGILGVKKQEGAQTATNTALKAGEAAASTAAASASAGDAVASATASGAKMPFPYNLLAIAAGVAAVVGALSMMNKFEKGGIVGGNSTHGDRNMVRVNSGEMILNKAQQGTLWSMLNGKGGMSGNVEFKIRGADLVGTINNHMSRKRG